MIWDPPESFFHLIIADADAALLATARALAPNPALLVPSTADPARPDLRIILDGGDDRWIDALVKSQVLPAERLLISVSCVSQRDANRVQVPEHVLVLLCRLGITQVEFSYISHDTTDYSRDDDEEEGTD